MNWYYADGTQQVGPVTEEQFNSLVASGKITPDTLVWRDGLADWKPLKDVRPASGGSAAAASGAPIEGGVVCSQCQKIFPQDQVIKYGDQSVCAGCKPAFVQRLKEGASVTGDMEYASVLARFGAKFLDNIILYAVNAVFNIAVLALFKAQSGEENIAIQLVLMGVGTIFGLVYATFFLGKYGATPGKMAAKIRVVNADGSPLTYKRALLRNLAEIVSGLTCGIGYLMAAFDDEKRSLHDRMVDTRVIKN